MKALLNITAIGCALTSAAAFAQQAASTAPAAAVKVKPGLWEMTSVIENQATTSRRSIVARECVAAADAPNVARIVPSQREPGMQCENRDLKRDGANITWTIACKSADAAQTGKGKLTLFGDSYLGTAEVELRKQGGKPVKLGESFTGKWLQACS